MSFFLIGFNNLDEIWLYSGSKESTKIYPFWGASGGFLKDACLPHVQCSTVQKRTEFNKFSKISKKIFIKLKILEYSVIIWYNGYECRLPYRLSASMHGIIKPSNLTYLCWFLLSLASRTLFYDKWNRFYLKQAWQKEGDWNFEKELKLRFNCL